MDGTKDVREKLTSEINSSDDNNDAKINKLLTLDQFTKERNPCVYLFNHANYFLQKHQAENGFVVHEFSSPTYDVTFETGKGNFEAPEALIEIGLIS